MNLLRFCSAFSIFALIAVSSSAQEQAVTPEVAAPVSDATPATDPLPQAAAPTKAVDWKSLGRPLSDDTKSMNDRYVYSQTETTTDKNIGIDEPVLAPDDVTEWLSQHIPEVFGLTPKDYDQKTILNQKYFTPKGYAEYVGALNAAQLPSVIKEKYFTTSAFVTDPPIVTAKGLRDTSDKTQPNPVPSNVYVWQVDAPISLNYKGAGLNNTKSYKILLKIEIVRIPMKTDSTLVAINGWRLEEYKPLAIPGPQSEAQPTTAVQTQ